jgi:asparagine synthase (glutamine-hydrolysing)
MCGITGFITKKPQNSEQSQATVLSMSGQLHHRGPDAFGTWISESNEVAFAHQRLAIVDLSPAGQQPMEGNKFILVFNGEIYNFRQIRNDLSKMGVDFKSHSDTEVLLYALEKWGIESTLDRLEGMFAFAAYAKDDNTLFLARDRMGEKPLYYSHQTDLFLFSSELKALKEHPLWQRNIDIRSLGLYFKHNNIPAPHTIYENTYKLKPGSYLTVDLASLEFTEKEYWSSRAIFIQGATNPFQGTPDQAAIELESILKYSIKDQMIADVPLGAFLSGGIDSSTVTSIMQSMSSTPIKTFSIGFNFDTFNEAKHAKAIARHLGTSHTELYVDESDARDVIPYLPEIYDEPFADSSQIPTYLVCKLAKEHVTVALSGDGGDELFSGYSRYNHIVNHWRKRLSYPGKMNAAALSFLASLPPKVVDAILSPALSMQGKYNKFISHRLRNRSWQMANENLPAFYLDNIGFWNPKSNLIKHPDKNSYELDYSDLSDTPLSPLKQLQYIDTQMYLPDDILCKVDRAGMAVSLETRIPLLNHKVVQFAATLPDSINHHNGKAKWPLQKILSNYVPNKLFERPKQGFAIPMGEWLRGPLYSWMMDLLNENTIREQGLFNPDAIEPIIKMHLDGNGDYSLTLWSLLMFQSWYNKQ